MELHLHGIAGIALSCFCVRDRRGFFRFCLSVFIPLASTSCITFAILYSGYQSWHRHALNLPYILHTIHYYSSSIIIPAYVVYFPQTTMALDINQIPYPSLPYLIHISIQTGSSRRLYHISINPQRKKTRIESNRMVHQLERTKTPPSLLPFHLHIRSRISLNSYHIISIFVLQKHIHLSREITWHHTQGRNH